MKSKRSGRTGTALLLLCLAGCTPASRTGTKPESDAGVLQYGIRGPCDSPDPREACTQTALGSLYLRASTRNSSSSEGRGALWKAAPDFAAIEACHREATLREPALACSLTMVVVVDDTGTQRLRGDPRSDCPSQLQACLAAAIRPLPQRIDPLAERDPPTIDFFFARTPPEDNRQ